jgi:hypothetical protein
MFKIILGVFTFITNNMYIQGALEGYLNIRHKSYVKMFKYFKNFENNIDIFLNMRNQFTVTVKVNSPVHNRETNETHRRKN